MGLISLKDSIMNKIEGTVGNVASIFGFGPSAPSYLYDVEDKNDIYSNSTPNRNFAKSLGYSFAVINSSGKVATGWREFNLQINPQTLEQDEEFSIQFFPTPKGIVVEHQGSIMKDITISGVTGVHPRRSVGGVMKTTGDLIAGKGDSGYKQFHDLRNYIRAYVEKKKNPDNRELRLGFYNFKDEEYFIVEPTRFSLKRDKSRPLMYEYTIGLRAIGRTSDITESSSLDNFLGTIDSIFETVGDVIAVARGVINESVEMLTAIDREVRSKVLDPLQQVELAIQDFRNGKTKVLNLPRRFIKDLKDQIRDIGDKLANKSGIDTSSYNTFFNKSSAFTPTTTKTPTYEERHVLNEFENANRALDLLAFDSSHFNETTDDTIDSINEIYESAGITGTNNANGTNAPITKAGTTKSVSILAGETLQDIAARLLGDASLFREIAIINQLKAPYISEEGGDGVLKYTDTILIPENAVEAASVKDIHRNIEYSITKNLSEVEKSYGVDLKLNTNKDIAITNTNDYDLIAGTPNVIQSVGIRLGVEKGSYKLHTEIGIDVGIGEKNNFEALTLKEDIQAQLLLDPRLEPGSRVFVERESNTIKVEIYAKMRRLGQGVPLQLVSQ